MTIRMITRTLIPVFTLGILLCACVKESGDLELAEGRISFGAAAGYTNDVETRTEYSGVDENGSLISSSSEYERIDWVADRDRIRILCAQALDEDDQPNTAGTYLIGTPTPSGKDSEADASLVSGSVPFFWGEDTYHYFYALYPAEGTTSEYFEDVVSASNSNITGLSATRAQITGAIPASQSAVKVTVTDQDADPDDDSYIYKPDMNLAYMYAAEKTMRVPDVTLHFHPLVTAFEFSLKALDDDMASYDLQSLKLSSTSTDLTGGFTATLDLDATTVATVNKANTGLGREITIALPTGTRLSKDVFSVFTFLALGVEQSNLKLTLTFVGGGTRSLALNKKLSGGGSEPITVGACKKAYFKLDVGAPEWEYHFGELNDLTFTYEGGSGNMAASFISYRVKGSTMEPVPFVLEYLEEGETEWSQTPPEWLIPGMINQSGSIDGQQAAMTVNPKDKYTYNPHHEELVKNERAKTDFDLSRLNVATSGWIDPVLVERSTSNCYVVQGPGTYKFPLVYGNGVTNGQINEYAFRALERVVTKRNNATVIEVTDQLQLDNGNSFRDHLDNTIYKSGSATSSPYIAVHLNKAGSDFTAFLLWEDEEGLLEVNPTITGEGENAYLSFSVPAENITQGNAVIAVKVGGKIAWSWHIWVTEQDLTNPDNPYSPAPLGWCDGKTIDEYAGRSCQVRATQETSGKIASAVITQTEAIIYQHGNATFYQFGRKDPIPGCSSTEMNTRKTTYPINNDYSYTVNNSDVTPGTAIQNPHMYYRSYGSSNNAANNWCKNQSQQYWNSSIYWNYRRIYYYEYYYVKSGMTETQHTKTMYDPSPVGYRVPRKSEFVKTGTLSTTVRGTQGMMSQYGFIPFAGFTRDTNGAHFYNGMFTFWTCTPFISIVEYSEADNFTSWVTHSNDGVRRAYGLSVFPVKELQSE